MKEVTHPTLLLKHCLKWRRALYIIQATWREDTEESLELLAVRDTSTTRVTQNDLIIK